MGRAGRCAPAFRRTSSGARGFARRSPAAGRPPAGRSDDRRRAVVDRRGQAGAVRACEPVSRARPSPTICSSIARSSPNRRSTSPSGPGPGSTTGRRWSPARGAARAGSSWSIRPPVRSGRICRSPACSSTAEAHRRSRARRARRVRTRRRCRRWRRSTASAGSAHRHSEHARSPPTISAGSPSGRIIRRGSTARRRSKRALNLGPSVAEPVAIGPLPGSIRTATLGESSERDLRPWLLGAALVARVDRSRRQSGVARSAAPAAVAGIGRRRAALVLAPDRRHRLRPATRTPRR